MLIYRLGLDAQAERDNALVAAARFQAVLKNPIVYKDTTLQVGSSIGMRLLDGKVADVDVVIRESDMAMYMAKQSGGGRIVFLTNKATDFQ